MEKRASEHLACYDQKGLNPTKKAIINLIESIGEEKDTGLKILDIGCGRGELVEYLDSMYDVWGLDIDENCVNICSEAIGDRAKQGKASDARKIFETDFDVVVMSHTLEHVKNPVEVIDQVNEIADDLILAVPNPGRPYVFWENITGRDYSNPGHVCCWDRSHFTVFLERRCNLRIMEWGQDKVTIPLATRVFDKIGLESVSKSFLPSKFPYPSNSLIVRVQEKS